MNKKMASSKISLYKPKQTTMKLDKKVVGREALTIINKVPAAVAIVDDETFNVGNDRLKALTFAGKQLKANKSRLLDPIKQLKEEIDILFKPFEMRLAEEAEPLKIELIDYANHRERMRLEALARLEKNKRITKPDTLMAKTNEIGGRADGTRSIMKLVISDKSLIPTEFLLVDEVAVRRALLQGYPVPGAALVEELTLTGR